MIEDGHFNFFFMRVCTGVLSNCNNMRIVEEECVCV